MLFKVVLDKQIRVFDCKEAPSINLIQAFISKTFPKLKNYTVYYLDEDNDHIVLETDSDLNIYLSNGNLKPKIYINAIKQQAFEATVKIEIENKEEEKQQGQKVQPVQSQNILPKKQQIQIKEQLAQKNEKKHEQVHAVQCDGCQKSPIIGIRFTCSVCKQFDLCQKCEVVHKHHHPLIKIRFDEQVPLYFKVQFNQARASLLSQQLKNSQIKNKQKIVYQTNTERQQIVISYLGNILGEDQFEKYKSFSKVCKSQNYDDIVEEYLNWTEKNETNFQKITNWILKYVAKIKQQFE